ncbi:MAG: 23S rRNA (uracil(1939)-C(5))-methyltransferase RlmD [Alphaproteobacteria bacterium]
MRRRRRKGGGRQYEVNIQSVGARGDGNAQTPDGKPLFVPLALAGEKVRIRELSTTGSGVVGEILELIETSAERVEPPCPHYGACGGCQLQHWQTKPYLNWKQQKVEDAVRRAGFDTALVGDIQLAYTADEAPKNRRRARLAFTRNAKSLAIGFRGRASTELEPIDGCLILAPEILEIVEGLSPWLMDSFADGEQGQLNVNLLDQQGVDQARADVTVIASREPGSEALIAASDIHKVRENLSANLVRVSWEYGRDYSTPILELEAPFHTIADIDIPVPYDVFLQPSTEGEAKLVELVLATVPEAEEAGTPLKIADLFSGIGTFALPIALTKGADVKAYEGFKFAVQALKTAVARSSKTAELKNFTTEQRNLESWPVKVDGLDQFDMLILDPPRTGAKTQVQEIAKSSVNLVTYVSCNPSTFSRDAKALGEAGFSLEKVTPVDQFPWTGHVELVAQFQR